MKSKYRSRIKTNSGEVSIYATIDGEGNVRQCSISVLGDANLMPTPHIDDVIEERAFNSKAYMNMVLDCVIDSSRK